MASFAEMGGEGRIRISGFFGHVQLQLSDDSRLPGAERVSHLVRDHGAGRGNSFSRVVKSCA
jgi:hypothetical protein